MNIDKKYLPALGRIFSPQVLGEIAEKGHSSFLSEVCINSGLIGWIDPKLKIREFFDWIYNFLFVNYRNEYIYKNAIANNILIGKHSLNTTKMLTEFRIGNSKADVVLLNGVSTIYEIKSQYDSFVRIEKQINSYLEVFDYINVITTQSQAQKLISILPEKIGILILKDKNIISTFRKARSNRNNINLCTLFNSLRKTEYIKVIREYYNYVPNVPNTIIYKECKNLFCNIPIDEAHDLAIKALKTRNNSSRLINFIKKAPTSIFAYAMTISNEKDKMNSLLNNMDNSINSVLTIPN